MFGVNKTEILGELQQKKDKLASTDARMEGLADIIVRWMWEWHNNRRFDRELASQAMCDMVEAGKEREKLLNEIARLGESL